MTVAGTTVPSAASAVPAAVGKEQEEESVALFQQNWTTYQKLLHVDFLEHKLLYGQLQDVLLHLFGSSSGSGSQGVAMLDMACGDAMQIARTLRRCGSPAGSLPLASYTGVDLSAPALALAAQHLAFLQPSASVHLIEQDMDAYVQACPAGQYDLAFASFAVHHLSTLEAKTAFLSHVARCLKPGGVCVLIDIFRLEDEDREGYMARYKRNMAGAVTAGVVEPAEGEMVMSHILNFDFPERLSDLQAAGPGAGFAGGARCVVTDSKQFGRLVVLSKSAAAAQAAAASGAATITVSLGPHDNIAAVCGEGAACWLLPGRAAAQGDGLAYPSPWDSTAAPAAADVPLPQ